MKEFTNNNLGHANNTRDSAPHKSIVEKFREYLAKRETHSLYIWQPNSRLRMFCQDLTSQGWFDFIILTFISANCITLAMERPNIPPWSTERYILGICNHIFTVVFAAEMAMKAIACGFIFGPDCYFSDNWNLGQHRKSVHLRINDFPCCDCNQAFSTHWKLGLHKKSVHLTIKDFDVVIAIKLFL